MEQSPSWEANRFSASQEIPRMLSNPKCYYHIHRCPPPVPIHSQLDPSLFSTLGAVKSNICFKPWFVWKLGLLSATIQYLQLAYRQAYKSFAAFSNRCWPSKTFCTAVSLFSIQEGLYYPKPVFFPNATICPLRTSWSPLPVVAEV
jgi:hypothetical protein